MKARKPKKGPLQAETGELLYRRVDCKIIRHGEVRRWSHHAGKGKGFSALQIEEHLLEVADKIEKIFPNEDFKLVPLGPTTFNFVHTGSREALGSHTIEQARELIA